MLISRRFFSFRYLQNNMVTTSRNDSLSVAADSGAWRFEGNSIPHCLSLLFAVNGGTLCSYAAAQGSYRCKFIDYSCESECSIGCLTFRYEEELVSRSYGLRWQKKVRIKKAALPQIAYILAVSGCLLIVLLNYHQSCLWYSLMSCYLGMIMRLSFLWCHWGIIKLNSFSVWQRERERENGRATYRESERVTCLCYRCCHSPVEAQLPRGCSRVRCLNPSLIWERNREPCLLAVQRASSALCHRCKVRRAEECGCNVEIGQKMWCHEPWDEKQNFIFCLQLESNDTKKKHFSSNG